MKSDNNNKVKDKGLGEQTTKEILYMILIFMPDKNSDNQQS